MQERQEVVADTPEGGRDDLLLPRPPGVFRRFWARHPRLTDALVASIAFLLSVPFATARASEPAVTPLEVWFTLALVVLASIALLFRRRRARLAFAAAVLPAVLLPPSLSSAADMLLAFAAYALAVYRSTRACWIGVAAVASAVTVSTILFVVVDPAHAGPTITNAIARLFLLVIGALIGANVGGRRRYLDALIDRSRQLATERDQQAALAAAAERTRIAREMHDIVSHSLTVVVALSEGAVAASSPERARQAARAAADTAREALTEMRAMLGVLREAGDEPSLTEPLAPVDPARVVEAARGAGFPVRLHTHGTTAGAPRAVLFALGRVVQEGLTNAMRHAPGASTIDLEILADTDAITVRIRNDGVRPTAAGSGFGLRGLRERVEHVGGTLTAGAVAPSAWELSAILPLPQSLPEETP